eukprot:TRINITY_DN9983_c0_g1_i1.p1 TRINITY_DN9983_c0_g1~~TRINITY_DN9983_c0_g1_i1.p1  ORF type:complete len:390 (-),score=98.05 TRINITY_DN9983_c0_g1_i1:120-1289(-)
MGDKRRSFFASVSQYLLGPTSQSQTDVIKDVEDKAKKSNDLIKALIEGRVEDAVRLVEEGANSQAALNYRDDEQNSLLHIAFKQEEVIKLLHSWGADLNIGDKTNWTPLHHACRLGSEGSVRLLVSLGANIEARNKSIRTPLYPAKLGSTAKILIEAGANTEARDEWKLTPLHDAATNGLADVVKVLLDAGADVHARDAEYRTPLHHACSKGHLEVAKLLLLRKQSFVFGDFSPKFKELLMTEMVKDEELRNRGAQYPKVKEYFRNHFRPEKQSAASKNRHVLLRVWLPKVNGSVATLAKTVASRMRGADHNFGHISMTVFMDGELTYVSHWPAGAAGFKAVEASKVDLPFDIKKEGLPDYYVRLYGLDVEKILERFYKLREKATGPSV